MTPALGGKCGEFALQRAGEDGWDNFIRVY
jgi:hypothetical protein